MASNKHGGWKAGEKRGRGERGGKEEGGKDLEAGRKGNKLLFVLFVDVCKCCYVLPPEHVHLKQGLSPSVFTKRCITCCFLNLALDDSLLF